MDSENVSETMLCPICLDIPPEAVFLCVNGHTICCKCCSTVERCPECRVPYKMGKIRNRVLETLLDDLELQCPYAAFGCPDKFGRGKLQSHANTCIFKWAQIGYTLDTLLKVNLPKIKTGIQEIMISFLIYQGPTSHQAGTSLQKNRLCLMSIPDAIQ